ncbi:MAG: hypothetical protein IGS54_04770 [Elainella sp. C42_A2020_010]|nr:hypothetical protein [Elainella sp. C42_A2020_010]
MNRLPLLRLLIYAKPYQTRIWSAIANSILNTVFDLAPPYLIGIAIDSAAGTQRHLRGVVAGAVRQSGCHLLARHGNGPEIGSLGFAKIIVLSPLWRHSPC